MNNVINLLEYKLTHHLPDKKSVFQYTIPIFIPFIGWVFYNVNWELL